MEPENAPSFFDFNLFGWPFTGLVTLFALAVYFWTTWNVGKARRAHGVQAPSMTGPDAFMRAFRTQQNTLEQLVLFLPLLWMAALSSRDEIAAAIGVIWPVARIAYALGYTREGGKRAAGFMVGMLVSIALFLLCAVQMVNSLFAFQSGAGVTP